MKHTPGPWEALIDRSTKGKAPRMAMVVAGGRAAIDCTASGSNFTQDCANARLVSAAPEMLACCIRALTQSARVHGDFMLELERVIAKATGE